MAQTNCEEWRSVPGYEGLYEVSNLGNVRSLFRYKKQIKPQPERAGYLSVQLFKNKKAKTWFVHRLVALAFVENPENKPQINHIDECKTNNQAENLEWVTAKENANHGTAIARRLAHTDYSKIKHNPENQIRAVSRPIAQYTKDGKFIRAWNSATEFCRANNKKAPSTVQRVCAGERKSAYGYSFRYLEGRDDLSDV